MKYTFLLKAYVPLLVLLLSVNGVQADVIWNATASDVINDDLQVNGAAVELPTGATRISATTTNVDAYINTNTVIRGNDSGESILYLRVDDGYSITFYVENNTAFIGSLMNDPLTIIQHGTGTVNFEMDGGKTVSFTSQSSEPTHYYLVMSDCGDSEANGIPTLCFRRNIGMDDDNNVQVNIGANSRMTYIAPDIDLITDETGLIKFDPCSPGLGRSILKIEDTGAFLINGHLVTYEEFDCANIQPTDIDLTTPAGSPLFSVESSCGSAGNNTNEPNVGLLVLNCNDTLSELLFDPFCDLGTRSDPMDYNGTFGGVQYGFILGANATMQILSDSYLDYVGLTNNQCPNADVDCEEEIDPEQLLKYRNASAFVVDGYHNPSATAAQIEMYERSAIFFRSGVASDGSISADYLVDDAKRTAGAGEIVFDVEGELNVYGPGATSSKFEILSWEVSPSGGSLFVESSEVIFPKRTFDQSGGNYLGYNCAAFLINNSLNLYNMSLMHTDECHNVFAKNDSKSEPTYIGGETFTLECGSGMSRPKIEFHNSYLRLHTDMAITGLDLIVPNTVVPDDTCNDNNSEFIFYYNGYCVDNGTGRNLILGTRIGATACDCCSVIDCDAHLDVIQLYDCSTDEGHDQVLQLLTAPNGECIVPVLGNTDKLSIHTIYLGCDSNISVGSNTDTLMFTLETNPCLEIAGNYFSFETHGGILRRPETSNVTGKGGIFVDLNGKFSIDPDYRASINVMVTKSRNGIVNLPNAQIYWHDKVGISDWKLDLSDSVSRLIVPTGEKISNYTLNWLSAEKDCENFCPYEVGDVTVCSCPEVTEMNVSSLPTIEGVVDQMQIQSSRIGDQAHVLIDGGRVRELVFLPCSTSAEAPVAAVVLRDDGRVGIGPLEQSYDSSFAQTTLGVNGITIIADGDGTVDLNQDMIVNNICAFLKGPNFTSGDELEITSTVPRELRVKSCGTLDFSSFNLADVYDEGGNLISQGDRIKFSGQIKLIIEPGAKIIMGNEVIFAEDTSILFEESPKVAEFFQAIPLGNINNALSPTAVVDASMDHNQYASLTNYGDGLGNTDSFRVVIAGIGTLLFKDNAIVELPFNAFVGVENILRCISTTDLTIELQDNAKFEIGNLDTNEGGALQIGNVIDLEESSVSFTLRLNGNNAEFKIGRLGFLGLGVGIVKGYSLLDEMAVPNGLLVDTTHNVSQITFDFNDGDFAHERIFPGNNIEASLLAINGDDAGIFTLDFGTEIGTGLDEEAELRASNFAMHGGGNIVLISSGDGAITPIVLEVDDIDAVAQGTETPRLHASIMASTELQDLNGNDFGVTGAVLFDELKTHDAVLETSRPNTVQNADAAVTGTSFRATRTGIRIGAVINGGLVRQTIFDVRGSGTPATRRERAVEIGAVKLAFDTNGNIIGAANK